MGDSKSYSRIPNTVNIFFLIKTATCLLTLSQSCACVLHIGEQKCWRAYDQGFKPHDCLRRLETSAPCGTHTYSIKYILLLHLVSSLWGLSLNYINTEERVRNVREETDDKLVKADAGEREEIYEIRK